MRWVAGRGWLTDPTFPNLPSAHRKQIMSVSRTARGVTPENLPLQWFSEASKKNSVRKSKKLPKTGQKKTEDHARIALLHLAEWAEGKEGRAAFAMQVNESND